jgi:hypothetical protein
MSHTPHPLEAVISIDGAPVARCVIRRGTYTIGSDRRNQIVIDLPTVSAQHAQLTVEGDADLFIEDLTGSHGTLIDGRPARGATPVSFDSQIEIGGAALEFQRGGIPASVFQFLSADFLSGSRYEIGDAIVQGRTSTIHEARDTALGRDIAMKIMLPESQAKAAHVLRFIRDAQITAQLQHPGILPVYDLGLDGEGHLYSTTRFVEGDSLDTILDSIGSADSPHDLAGLVGIFLKACDVLAYAHSRGVVHCALNPADITVGRFGEVFIGNWNLAKVVCVHDEPEPRVRVPEAASQPALSRYSAPEQAEGAIEDIDRRTDIHALGGILYRIITLHDPITAESDSELLEQALSPRREPAREPVPPHWPGGKFPEALTAAAMKAMSLSPDDRHSRVAELQAEIGAHQGASTARTEGGGKLWKKMGGLLGRH